VRFKILFFKKHQIDIFLVFFDDFNILISQKNYFDIFLRKKYHPPQYRIHTKIVVLNGK